MQRHEHNRVKYRYFINGLFDEIPVISLFMLLYIYIMVKEAFGSN